ncbi:class II aaRS and biotin synthetase [Neoconidiobolus thromboides FSU 785]|nr:class II aaRS and biotin synthetase [Neoconidiobolus thromboides FSU 785]
MTIAGRILQKREASNKLLFYEIMVNHQSIQLVMSKNNWTDKEEEEEGKVSFEQFNKLLKRGDIVEFSGFIGKTQIGTLSLFNTTQPILLTPCLPELPLSIQLGTIDKRYRKKYLDFMLNQDSRRAIYYRFKTISVLRNYLETKGFIEVETPILSTKVGGANAKPFITKANAMDDLPLNLRIAPELYLKQMIIGGFDKVYEVGKVFRNESMDTNHNPEFTTCEFYHAYANLDNLFQMTEELLKEIVLKVTGSYELKISTFNGEDRLIDFSQPFQKINVYKELQCLFNNQLPDLNGEITPFMNYCHTHSIKLERPYTMSRILDKIIAHHLEPKCFLPTFLYNHPTIMSPLAKSNRKNRDSCNRFELFINHQEFVNAYEELNDPIEQNSRFLKQVKDKEDYGDLEAQPMDSDFCYALAYGLPPTAGWGLGIDRLITLLLNAPNIRETLSFPLMKPIKE